MWKDTTPAVQAVAKAHFADYPGTETMLATTDGNLFGDNTVGENYARQHATNSNTEVVRLTRAGGVAACVPRKGTSAARMVGGLSVGGRGIHY